MLGREKMMSARIGKTFVFSGLAITAGMMSLPQDAQGATIAGWTFETVPSGSTTAASVGPIAAEVGTGSAFGVHALATSVFTTPAGNGSVQSLNSSGWTGGNSDFYEFRTSSTGFTDLIVNFDQTRSGTGPNSFDFQYSTNGTTFTSFSTYTLAGTGFSTGTAITGTAGVNFAFDLSAIDSLENLSTVYFRLRNNNLNSSGGAVTATAGTSRVDNFFIQGTAGGGTVPEPTSMALAMVGAAGLVARRRRD
jgi:hypothetical protein